MSEVGDGPNRREPKSFEPPPWERDQFDELAKRREDEQKEAELDQALAQLAVEKAAEETKIGEQAEAEPDVVEEESSSEQADSADELPGVDEKMMEAMLTQLRMEEPRAETSLWKVSLVLSLVSALLGSILIVWGAAALWKKSGVAAGFIGGSIIVLFGALFVGIGAWMAVRSLKERGVL